MIGGLGVQELLIVLVVAMFLFGGKKLPEIGQNLGKAIRGFKEGSEGEEEKGEEKAIDEASPSKNNSTENEEPGVKKDHSAQPQDSEETKEPETNNPEEKTK